MSIANAQLGTSETVIVQSGASESKALLVMIFCNTDAASHSFTVYAYPSGGSASASTTIISSLSLAAGDSYIWSANEKFILSPNDKISGIADTSNVITVTHSYMVI